MANTGGGAAYVRLQTPEDGVGQALQFWGAQDAKRVGEEKLAAERAGIRKDEAIKEWEKTYNLKAEDFKNKYTGFKSFDDMNTDFSLYATDQYVTLQRQAKEAMVSGDARGKAKAEGEMIKLKGAFGEASKSQAALGVLFEGYQKASREGKVSGASKDFEDAMQSGFKDMNVALRFKDGNLVYTGLTKDGKVINIPQQDIMDGSFAWIEKQQIDGKGGLVDNILNNLGTITKEGQNGYYKITTQAWDEKIHGEAAKNSIEALTGSDDTMADLLYQFSQGKESKRQGFTPADYKMVSDKLRENVKAGYTQKFGSEFNTGKYNADLDAQTAKARLAAEKTKPKTKTQEEQAFGARKWNINQVRDNSDISFFSAGDFKWNGATHEAASAKMVGNEVVIRTTEGEVIKVPKDNETALNDLFNAFEGKTMAFDKVQSVEPLNWRAERQGAETDITNVLSKQYSPAGQFIGEETPFAKDLRRLYPEATIEESNIGVNEVVVNGVAINLDRLNRDQVEVAIRQALGKGTSSTTSAKSLIDKYRNK